MMALGLDLSELSRHLKQERLFVTSEREALINLFEQVKTAAEQLYHQSWIGRQQKDVLDKLIQAREVTPAECCSLTNQIELSTFVDGYKQLSYHDAKYGEFLKFLIDNPYLIGQLLALAEKNGVQNSHTIVKVLMHSVYGNCVLEEDEMRALNMLKSLLELQLAVSDNPRRMLRRGSCAFSIAFKQLFDVIFSAKLFLTAALHDPVMRLLMEDEWFYDIDPGKALVRFPPQERMRRFGEPGTDQYKEKLSKYRTTIVEKLVIMATRFVTSIKNNMHCFPPSLGWLVSQVYQNLTKSGKLEMAEVRAVCADLVFALFICPAICDPEPHGITTDVPISHIARHNLMQMAQIIQVLAISQPEEMDPKLRDLYGRFEKGCMSSLLDSLLDGIGIELPSASTSSLACLARTSSLIPMTQLNALITFMRESVQYLNEGPEKKNLDEILAGLTPVAPVTPQTPVQNPIVSVLTPSCTPPGTPATQKKGRGKKKVTVHSQISQLSDETSSISSFSMETEPQPTIQTEDVLVIQLGIDSECPGMMSEQKVLTYEQENKRRRVKYQAVPGSYDMVPVEIQEKRTRFSLSHDQESIDNKSDIPKAISKGSSSHSVSSKEITDILSGNTSDIPEAISEGASSHSVGSQDLENDDDNDDNFSDMISANVSGRGTPNISGRDTPLSQAESGGERDATVPHNPQPQLPEIVQKKNREDVTDKFGKFEIKQELDYDLKSTVSDTWSTDVLASDSEPPEMNQQVRLEEIAEEMVRQQLLATQERVSEMSETASDAWSTDVLASDTDEKQVETLSEFDDVNSVAELGSNLDEVRSESDTAEGNEVTPLASEFDKISSIAELGSHLDEIRSKSDTAEGNEVTPQALGFQSPSEVESGELYQAAAGASAGVSVSGGNSVKSDTLSTSPTYSDSVFTDLEAPDRPRPDRNLSANALDSNRLFVPIKKKRAPSPPSSSPDKIRGADSRSFMTNAPNKSGLVDSYVLHQRPISNPETYSGPTRDLPNLNLVPNAITPESGARPKVQSAAFAINSNFSALKDTTKKKKNVSNLQLRGETPATTSSTDDIFRTDGKGRASTDSGVSSAQFIESMESGVDVQVSEQQNSNVDETRFSAALSLFDPLSPNNDTSSGDLLEGAGSPPDPNYHRYTDSKYKGAEAAPLVDVEASSDNSQFKFDISPAVRTAGPHSQANVNLKQNGMTGDESCDMFMGRSAGQAGIGEKRRGSTDSNRSSESYGSKDGSAAGDKLERSSLDNSTQQVDDKDMPNGDESMTHGKKRGLFRTFKEKIGKGIKKKGTRHDKDLPQDTLEATPPGAVAEPDKSKVTTSEPNIIITETSDDILAKYRKKSILTSTPSSEPTPTEKERRLTLKDPDDTTPLYDPNNLENCLAFLDAKRKLRMVLSSGDFLVGQGIFSHSCVSYSPRELDGGLGRDNNNNDLVNLLRAQLSEAINLQSRDTIPQLHEAIRCVRMFNADGCKKLVRSLQEDYRTRASYVSYLVRCKQGLLNTLSHINRLQNRIRREKDIYNKHMTNVFVRFFMDSYEKHTSGFINEFQKLTVSDEKTDLVERFLQFLNQFMNKDPTWQAATEGQLDDARLAIERYIMSRIYTHAMFPNGDGDIQRDQLIQNHIKQLSKVISPDHKDLRIPKMYHLECPWPAAQREIYMINAYKTPKDKLKCVQRSATIIMNLLSMANEKSVPAADDFMPVFIYVIIKANPPCLLSTIQYVNSFYENRLQGEEQYWWMQFSAAVEFIKTMRESEA